MLDLKGIKPGARIYVSRVNPQHRLPDPEIVRWKRGKFELDLAPSSLAILEIANGKSSNTFAPSPRPS